MLIVFYAFMVLQIQQSHPKVKQRRTTTVVRIIYAKNIRIRLVTCPLQIDSVRRGYNTSAAISCFVVCFGGSCVSPICFSPPAYCPGNMVFNKSRFVCLKIVLIAAFQQVYVRIHAFVYCRTDVQQ